MTIIFWVLFAYCVGERLFEVALSLKNRSQMAAKGFAQREPLYRLAIMIAVHVGWYLAMLVEHTMARTEFSPLVTWTAVTLFALIQGLRVWTLSTLGEYWNVSVMSTSKDAADFVSAGPYQWIRHPNYLVVVVELFSLPLVGGAPCTALIFTILNALVLKSRIAIEETHLFAVPGYRETMGNKGRFFPRLNTATRSH